MSVLGIKSIWKSSTLMDCLDSWFRTSLTMMELPCFMIWATWKAQNCSIFENTLPHHDSLCGRIIAAYKEFISHSGRQLKNLDFSGRRLAPLVLVFPCGFFLWCGFGET